MKDKHRRGIRTIVKKQGIEKSGLLRKIMGMLDEVISQEVSPCTRII
jgi:hypothetical protein